MKHIKIKIISFFILLISGCAIAQNKKAALSIYHKHGYKASIPLLENSAQTSFDDKEKIANSYRLNHDTENAEFWFQLIVEETTNPLHYLYYAQALQSNEKDELANQYFLMYENITGDTMYTDRSSPLVMEYNTNKKNTLQVTNVSEINSEKIDFSPAYYEDNIIFVSNRYNNKLSYGIKDLWTNENFMTIWSASKKSDGTLNEPVIFSKSITTKYNEGPISVNRDGDKIFFTRNDYRKGKRKNNSKGVMKLEIYRSVKIGDLWTTPKALEFNSSEYDEAHPSISYNGDRLYFSSNREGGFGGMDLYYSDFVNGKWTEPVNLGEKINTPGNDVFPNIHKDGTLYFASNGRLGFGGLDMYQVSRNENKEWNKVVNMGQPFNSPKDDFALVLNESKTEGYFTSARKGGHGLDDIYMFKSDNPIVTKQDLKKEVDINLSDSEIESNKIDTEVIQSKNLDHSIPPVDKTTEMKNSKSDITLKTKNTNQVDKNNLNTLSDSKITVPHTKNEKIEFENSSSKELRTIPKKQSKEETALKIENKNTVILEDKSESGIVLEAPYIYYDFNSSYIRNDVKKYLDHVVNFMTQYPSVILQFRSHTDSRGSESYNQLLSQKRANSVVQYLTQQGISPKRLIAKGYGEKKIRNKCGNFIECSEEEHQYNRRTEIRVIGLDQQNIEIKYLENLPREVDRADPNREWDWN